MKFERTKDKESPTNDSECYRKFLAGNKTLYTKAFWENGPRSKPSESIATNPQSDVSPTDASHN